MHRMRIAALSVIFLGAISLTSASADQAHLFEIDPDSIGPNHGYVVLTSSGVGILRMNGELLLETGDGYMTPLDGINEEVIVAWPEDTPNFSTIDVEDMKCVKKRCPDGWVLDDQKRYRGCARIPSQDDCFGDCISCAGSQNWIQMCERNPGTTCILDKFGTVLPPVDCGLRLRIVGGCTWVGGTSIDPRGCGCQNVGNTESMGRNCLISQCRLDK